MPLEIRELVVKVTVEENTAQNTLDEKKIQEIKKAIIRECIEEVLNKLENQPGR